MKEGIFTGELTIKNTFLFSWDDVRYGDRLILRGNYYIIKKYVYM